MNVDRLVFALAGSLILISVLLAYVHSAHWLWLTVFVGANMLQAAFTGFCLSAEAFKRFGAKPGEAFH